MIQENLASYRVVTLAADDYWKLIEDLAQVGVTGGAVYDAVIAKAAELAKVDILLSLNVGHFQRVCPEGANRVVSPTATTPPNGPPTLLGQSEGTTEGHGGSS